jgi:hypothetical protein
MCVCQDFNQYSKHDIKDSLAAYKQVHGHLDVPFDYVLTPEIAGDYPPIMSGAPLGRIFDALRRRRLFFNWMDVQYLWKPLEIVFERRNAVTLPDIIESKVMRRAVTAQQQQEMLSLSSDDVDDDKNSTDLHQNPTLSQFPRMLEALTIFKQFHGHFNVSPTYRIGVDCGYPPYLINYPLGTRLRQIRLLGQWTTSPYREHLTALGVIPPEDMVSSGVRSGFCAVCVSLFDIIAVHFRIGHEKQVLGDRY